MIDPILASPMVTSRGPALRAESDPSGAHGSIPGYVALLKVANGIIIRDGVFRVFGLGDDCVTRDVVSWNRSSWRSRFPELGDAIPLWGENIFGDQFGFDLVAECVVLFKCDGAALERTSYRGLTDFIWDEMLSEPPAIEMDLIEAARGRGLRPSPVEHLGFVLPLVCGGKADAANLEVMDGAAHLDLLGQITQQLQGVPEGTTIRGFTG